MCRKPTPTRRKAYVCNNHGFIKGQELSDWLVFQFPRRTYGLTHVLCLVWVLRHTLVLWYDYLVELLVCLHVEFGSWITKRSWRNIAPVQKEFLYLSRKGHGRWNLEAPDLAGSSANARKDIIDGISCSRSRRGQIAKCVRALHWACVERAWSVIRMSTAATHDGVSIRISCSWFASTSNLGRRHS